MGHRCLYPVGGGGVILSHPSYIIKKYSVVIHDLWEACISWYQPTEHFQDEWHTCGNIIHRLGNVTQKTYIFRRKSWIYVLEYLTCIFENVEDMFTNRTRVWIINIWLKSVELLISTRKIYFVTQYLQASALSRWSLIYFCSDPHTTISKEKPSLQNFLVFSEMFFQYYKELWCNPSSQKG